MTSRSTTRRGPSSRCSRRKFKIRSVIAASPVARLKAAQNEDQRIGGDATGGARWRRDAPALTRHPRPFVPKARRLESRLAPKRPIRCCAVGYVAHGKSLAAIPGSVAIDWKGDDPVRTPGKRDKPLR